MSKNRAASIRARLKNRSDAAKQDFNLTLTHYGLERLLYRLSVSSHAPNFLLKGALLFKLWYDVPHRPTRDADLLGFGPDDVESVAAVFRDVCVIDVDDGIVFEAGSVKTVEIRKEAGNGGVRVELRATLDESPRVSWRLQPLREWSHEQIQQIFPRSTRTRSPDGAGASGRVPLAMGSH